VVDNEPWMKILNKLKAIPDLKAEDLDELIGYSKENGKVQFVFITKK
jgi:hypothetical protein